MLTYNNVAFEVIVNSQRAEEELKVLEKTLAWCARKWFADWKMMGFECKKLANGLLQ